MDVVGIICEYNPFHNGHLYHIKKIKEMYKDSLIILVLNGYFLERGEISTISKEDKVKIALSFGIDLVVELPFVYGTQSADTFASKSIEILNALKCKYLVFGSESNDINTLNLIANYMIINKDIHDKDVKLLLDEGTNYPTAMAKSLKISNFKFKSNDLLAISYIKAIKTQNANIIPITIKRTNDYLDTLSNDKIISATNIRNRLKNNEKIGKYIPKNVSKYIKNIDLNNIYDILKYKIITDDNLEKYLDVDEGIHYRLKKVIVKSNNIDELISNIKSKRYTYNKIKRMLIHILIGLKKEDNDLYLDYIKVLGFNSNGQKYLNKIKKNNDITFTPNKTSKIYDYELKSALIYDYVTNGKSYEFEIKNKPIKNI